MIRLMHIITDLDIGGAEAMLYKLLSHLDQQKFTNSVVSLKPPGPLGDEIGSLGIPVYDLRMGTTAAILRGFLQLVKLIFSWKPDMIQTWLYHADLLGLLVGRLAGADKIVWNVRCSNVDFEYYARTTRWLLWLLSKLSYLPDAVIVNSEAGKAVHLQEGYRPKRWKIIFNGFDIDQYRPSLEARIRSRRAFGVDESARIIGMVARYDPIKDHPNFFAAARKVSAALPGVNFALCGEGMNEQNSEVLEMIQRNGLTDKTLLLGQRDDMYDIFPAFDINTLSSLFEGFPNVLGEAMACGVPCVATDVGDSAYIIGDTGKVVAPGNPEALAQAWLELLSMSSEEMLQLGVEARKRIEEKFSISKVSRQYEALYLNLLK